MPSLSCCQTTPTIKYMYVTQNKTKNSGTKQHVTIVLYMITYYFYFLLQTNIRNGNLIIFNYTGCMKIIIIKSGQR